MPVGQPLKCMGLDASTLSLRRWHITTSSIGIISASTYCISLSGTTSVLPVTNIDTIAIVHAVPNFGCVQTNTSSGLFRNFSHPSGLVFEREKHCRLEDARDIDAILGFFAKGLSPIHATHFFIHRNTRYRMN